MKVFPLLLQASNESMVKHLLESENPSTDSFMAEFLTMLLMLAMTLIGMLIVAWLLKRFLYTRLAQANQTSGIRVEERRALGPRSLIYLVEIEGTRIIIGETPSGLSRLGELPPKNHVVTPPSFSKFMDQDKPSTHEG